MSIKHYFIAYLALLSLPMAGNAQCRLPEESLTPIISKFNPFFTDHVWENDSKTETARMDPDRMVIIRQKSCLRHHVLFTLIIEKAAVEDNDRFWITEALVLLKRAYFDQPEYLEYKTDFEKAFVRQFQANGVNTNFTFPVNDRTFICRIESEDWGAKIKVESVKFVLTEKVRQPGIAREEDDGWYSGRPPRPN